MKYLLLLSLLVSCTTSKPISIPEKKKPKLELSVGDCVTHSDKEVWEQSRYTWKIVQIGKEKFQVHAFDWVNKKWVELNENGDFITGDLDDVSNLVKITCQ